MRALAFILVLTLAATPQEERRDDARMGLVKKLEGDWLEQKEDGTQGKEVALRYEITAGGSAVLETLKPGAPMEMISVYHMDGPDLIMTHYCAMQNQPTMKSGPDLAGNRLSFHCHSVSNVESHDEAHMHTVTITLVDDATLKHEWTLFEKGKVTKTITMTFVRKTD